jgi:hypothetical protein
MLLLSRYARRSELQMLPMSARGSDVRVKLTQYKHKGNEIPVQFPDNALLQLWG